MLFLCNDKMTFSQIHLQNTNSPLQGFYGTQSQNQKCLSEQLSKRETRKLYAHLLYFYFLFHLVLDKSINYLQFFREELKVLIF